MRKGGKGSGWDFCREWASAFSGHSPFQSHTFDLCWKTWGHADQKNIYINNTKQSKWCLDLKKKLCYGSVNKNQRTKFNSVFMWAWFLFYTILVLSVSPWIKKSSGNTNIYFSIIKLSHVKHSLGFQACSCLTHKNLVSLNAACLYLVRRCRWTALCSRCSLCFTLILPYCAANSEFHTFSLRRYLALCLPCVARLPSQPRRQEETC